MLVSRRHFASLASLGLAGFPFRLRAARPRPKLIVLLIAEQFRADYLDIFSNFLVPGGFRRLDICCPQDLAGAFDRLVAPVA